MSAGADNMNVGIINLSQELDTDDETIIEKFEPWFEKCATFKHNHGVIEYIVFLGAQEHGAPSINEFETPPPKELEEVFTEAFNAGYVYLCVYCEV